MEYLSIVGCLILSVLNTLLSKKFEQSFTATFLNFIKYNLINAFFACFFLLAMNGFKFGMNVPTLIYSVAYAIIVISILILNLFAYKYAPMPLVSIISTSGSIVSSSVFTLIHQGSLTIVAIIASVLMLTALVLPLIGSKLSFHKATIPVCIAFFLISSANTIILKLFTLTPSVTDSGSFFIMTNIIIVIIALASLLVFILSKKATVKETIKPLPLKQCINILIRTAASNASSLLSIFAIALMSLTVYSTLTSALGIVSAFLLSLLYFKEKTNAQQIISVSLAVCAIIISIF